MLDGNKRIGTHAMLVFFVKSLNACDYLNFKEETRFERKEK